MYAVALEYGMHSVTNQYGTWDARTYHPRPFMRDTARVMRLKYREKGHKTMKHIAVRIHGKFAG